MSRPRGMISPSGRGILSSRGLVSPTRWLLVMMRKALVMMTVMMTTDTSMMILRTFPSQGWSCEFSLEKGSPRIRPSGARNASHEETQDAIWVSRASNQVNFPQKPVSFQWDGHGHGRQSDGVNYWSCKQPLLVLIIAKY